MSVEALKSASVTNLDATPAVANAVGAGAEGVQRVINDYFVPSAAASVGSTYQTVRVPTNVKMKSLTIENEAQGAGKVNVGAYYSDDQRDGTTLANSGLVISANFFATDYDLAGAVGPTQIINQSGNNPIANRNLPLWKALGLASDPGGMFDIVATVHTTAVTTGTGKVALAAHFVM